VTSNAITAFSASQSAAAEGGFLGSFI